MKICLVNNLYKPYDRGGTERIVELLVNQLVKDHQVLLLTTQPVEIKNCQVNNNLTICRYNPQNLYYLLDDFKMSDIKKFIWHFFNLFNFKIAKEIKNELVKFKPDCVMTHNLVGFSFRIPKIIRKLKIFHIHVTHDYQLIDPHGSLHRLGRNLLQIGGFLRIYGYISKSLIKSPDLVISPSKFVLEKHLQYGFFKKSKTVAMPNPATVETLNFNHQDSNQIRFLYLGQVEEHKGIVFLVKTFLKWQNPKGQLIIAGTGSCLEKIKQLVKDDQRVQVLGKVNRKQVNEQFNQADILLVPSIWWENSPTVIYEAYSQGVPVLVSDSGGSKELVNEGSTGSSTTFRTGPSTTFRTGWIFKSADENDLLKKLNHLAVIKEDLKSYGQNGHDFVQQFSVDNYITKLLKLCQELKK